MYTVRRSAVTGSALWRFRANDAHRVVPDGAMDLMRSAGRLVVTGPDTMAYIVDAIPGRAQSAFVSTESRHRHSGLPPDAHDTRAALQRSNSLQSGKWISPDSLTLCTMGRLERIGRERPWPSPARPLDSVAPTPNATCQCQKLAFNATIARRSARETRTSRSVQQSGRAGLAVRATELPEPGGARRPMGAGRRSLAPGRPRVGPCTSGLPPPHVPISLHAEAHPDGLPPHDPGRSGRPPGTDG